MVDPRNLLRTVETAARKAGIEDVGAHTMRYSAAVSWLESGVHIKAAADLLGHSSISITGDLYGHTAMTRRVLRSTVWVRRCACEPVFDLVWEHSLGTARKKKEKSGLRSSETALTC